MKNFFAQKIACILIVIAISITTNVYSQKTEKWESKSQTINSAMLIGKWKVDNDEYTFDKSGTSLIQISGRECPGSWILNGNTLTINPKKLMWKKDDPCSKTKVLEIVKISNDNLVATDKEGEKKLHFTKQK